MSKESDFGLLFRHWMKSGQKPKHHWSSMIGMPPGGYELKDTRGKNYFVMSEWTEAQRNHVRASASREGNLIRVQAGTIGAPDYIYLVSLPSYLVIKFPNFFSIFQAETMLNFSDSKMTEKQAKEKCMFFVETKKTR